MGLSLSRGHLGLPQSMAAGFSEGAFLWELQVFPRNCSVALTSVAQNKSALIQRSGNRLHFLMKEGINAEFASCHRE